MVKLNNKKDVVAVIAGGGDAPKLVIDSLRKQKVSYVVSAIVDNTNPGLLGHAPYRWFKLGEMRKIFSFLREHKVTKVLFIGSISRPSFSSLKLDSMGLLLIVKYGLGKLSGGDNRLLTNLLSMFESKGYAVISPESVNPELVVPSGLLGKIKPTSVDMKDIEVGRNILSVMGKLDVGQSVIVEREYVLGIEAAEGTSSLVKRCKSLKKDKKTRGVLVKMKKTHQDTRVDLPAIGVRTIDEIAESGLRGIAVKSGSSLIIDIDKVVARANERKIFIIGI